MPNKLGPSTNLPVLYKDFAIDDIALEVLQTLASEDFPDIKVFYEQGVERDLRNKAGKVRCFGMRDMSGSKGEWAFYVIDLEDMEITRYLSARDVEDRFLHILETIESPRAHIIERGVFKLNEREFIRDRFPITPQTLPFIKTCLDNIYTYPTDIPSGSQSTLPGNDGSSAFGTENEQIRSGLNKGMPANNMYRDLNAFPDGKGSYFIDDYGMPGRWSCNISFSQPVSNRLIIRVVDSVSRTMKDALNLGYKVEINFVDSTADITDEDVVHGQDNSVVISFSAHTIFVTPEFAGKSRDSQEDMLKKLLGTRARELLKAIEKEEKSVDTDSGGGLRPGVIISQIAIVETQRAKDYLHYKFNYRLEAFSKSLKKQGYASTFMPIEDNLSSERFLEEYRSSRQDIVVLSIYQVKEAEIEQLYKLVDAIRKINPGAFIVVEGPSANMAKQLLALCPDIDMLVRGEAEGVISKLVAIKKKGQPLTISDIARLVKEVEGGIFIRSGSYVEVSNFNVTNINQKIELLEPTRDMFCLWYPEHGCPNICAFCRKDTGGSPHKRIVSAEKRIEWMLGRLMLEIDPSSNIDMDTLKKVLKEQADNTHVYIGSHPNIRLLWDTFIGNEKVEILVLSENALVNRRVMMQFANLVREYGLQKYFKFKIADAGIKTLFRNGKPDIEYMRALKDMGVYFIGFGTENLSSTILSQLGKGGRPDYPGGYSADEVIAVNKALLEVGFRPTDIRNNLIFTAPNSNLSDVKDAMLLVYASPVFNSVPFYFGNGWGNNRYPRTLAVAGSLFAGIDHIRYASRYDLKPLEESQQVYSKASVIVSESFYIAKETPEYMIRREGSRLKYVDENLPRLSEKFGYPTFYRYAQQRFLLENFTREDVLMAVDSWSNCTESQEVRALGNIMNIYLGLFSEKEPLSILFILKVHMVSLKMLSFAEYLDILQSNNSLPLLLEECRVGELFAKGDNLMEPGSFSPDGSIENFRRAVLIASIVSAFARITEESSNKGNLHAVIGICLRDDISKVDKLREIGNLLCEVDFVRSIEEILESNGAIKKDIEHKGYLGRISYPDSQVFEYLRHLYVIESDEELFNMIVERMNSSGIDFSDAVNGLVCERLDILKKEYQGYIKAVKEYETVRTYYCRGGLFHKLRSKDPAIVSAAVEDLLNRLKSEDNKYIIKNISLVLCDLANRGGLFSVGAFIASVDVIDKIRESLDIKREGEVLILGTALSIVGQRLNNRERVRIIKEKLQIMGYEWPFTAEQDDVFAKGDWMSLRVVSGNKIVLTGTCRYEADFLKNYSGRMRFRNNTELFSAYLGRLSEISGKHRIQIIKEIKDFFEKIKDRPYSRYALITSEIFLYMIPVIKRLRDTDAVPLFVARSMEPFYNAWWVLAEELGDPFKEIIDNAIYTPISRRLDKEDYKELRRSLLAKSIIPLLTQEEAEETIDEITWDVLIKESIGRGIKEELDHYLEDVWEIKGGIEKLKDSKISKAHAILYLSGFGIDPRFERFYLMTRRIRLPGLVMSEEFRSRGEEDGFPVDELKAILEGYIRSYNEGVGRNTRISEDEARRIIEGIELLGGKEGRLLYAQQNLIFNFMIIFSDAKTAAGLRNKMAHKARPLLNILLGNTNHAERFSSRRDNILTLVSIDETSTSSVSMLLSELVLRSFNDNINHKTYNVAQRTKETKEIFEGCGMLDGVSVSGIWLQEDINGEYQGAFVDHGQLGRKYKTYRDFAKDLWEQQSRVTPEETRENLILSIENLNKFIDRFVSEHEDLFKFVDGKSTIRHDPKVIKRQIVKYIIRYGDPIERFILEDNYFACIRIGETDFAGLFSLMGGVRKMLERALISFIPKEIIDMDKKIRCADQALEIETYVRRNSGMTDDYLLISRDFMEGHMSGHLHRYLSGEITFEELQDYFYENYKKRDKDSYITREIYFNPQGEQIYIITNNGTDDCSAEILSHEGLKAATSCQDPLVREAAQRAIAKLRAKACMLREFIDGARDINVNTHEMILSARENLERIRHILGVDPSPDKSASAPEEQTKDGGSNLKGMGEVETQEYEDLQFVDMPKVELNPEICRFHTIRVPEEKSDKPIIYELCARSLGKRFSEITDEEIQAWAGKYNYIWMMGVWKESEFSKKYNKRFDKRREASSYAIPDYVINPLLGGEEEFRDFVNRCSRFGLKVIIDFVPNHMSADSPWIAEHPEWFIEAPADTSVPEDPIQDDLNPCYRYGGPGGPIIYHGKDPNYIRWGDTAQLNIIIPELRTHLIRVLKKIARLTNGGGVRCDMVHLTLKKHIHDFWWPYAEQEEFDRLMPKEFWEEAIQEVKKEYPDFIFIGEAYWEKEGYLQSLGFDYTYDDYMYKMLREGNVQELRRYLTVSPKGYFDKSLHYLANHDEGSAKDAFGERERAAAMLIATLPGSLLIPEGQEEGFRESMSAVWVRRALGEVPNPVLRNFYASLLKIAGDPLFREGDFSVVDFETTQVVSPSIMRIAGSSPYHNIIAYTRRYNDRVVLVITNYSKEENSGAIDLKQIAERELTNYISPERDLSEDVVISGDKVQVNLRPWETRIFELTQKKDRIQKLDQYTLFVKMVNDTLLWVEEKVLPKAPDLMIYYDTLFRRYMETGPPVVLRIAENLNVNSSHFYNPASCIAEKIFSLPFVKDLLQYYERYPIWAKAVLFQRLFHELGHYDVAQEEAELIERDIQLIELYGSLGIQNEADTAFKKLRKSLHFRSGYYYYLLKALASMGEGKRRIVIEQFVSADVKGKERILDMARKAFLTGHRDKLMYDYMTYFFWNVPHYKWLKEIVLPRVSPDKRKHFRVAVLGCCTGQEPISLAIWFLENGYKDFEIVSVDNNRVILDIFEKGVYSKEEMDSFIEYGKQVFNYSEDQMKALIDKYFQYDSESATYRLREELKDRLKDKVLTDITVPGNIQKAVGNADIVFYNSVAYRYEKPVHEIVAEEIAKVCDWVFVTTRKVGAIKQLRERYGLPIRREGFFLLFWKVFSELPEEWQEGLRDPFDELTPHTIGGLFDRLQGYSGEEIRYGVRVFREMFEGNEKEFFGKSEYEVAEIIKKAILDRHVFYRIKIDKMGNLENVQEVKRSDLYNEQYLVDALGDLVKEYEGSGILSGIKEVEIVDEDGSFVSRVDSKARIGIDKFRDKNLVIEDIEHEALREILGLIIPENPILAEVVAKWYSVRRFLKLGEEERQRILKELGPSNRYIEFLRHISSSRLEGDDLIKAVIDYVKADFDVAVVKSADVNLEQAIRLFNELGEAGRLVSEVRETERRMINVIKTFNGIRIEGKIPSNIRRLIGLIARHDKWTIPEGTKISGIKYVVYSKKRMGSDLEVVMDDIKKKYGDNIRFVDKYPEGVNKDDVIVLIDPEDAKDWKGQKGQDLFYLPLPYMRLSLYLAVELVFAGRKNMKDTFAYSFAMEFYNGKVTDEEIWKIFYEPWDITERILLEELNILREAVIQLDKFA